MPVVQQAKSLGVVFGSAGVVGTDWAARMDTVKQRLQRISRLPNLSAFGRAFAANAYALSTLLYAAQYTGQPPQQHAGDLRRWLAALVDAGRGPLDDMRRPPGIPASCMAAHPRDGGFGLLSVQHHLFSRWACEGVRLLVGAGERHVAPWVAAGSALLGCVFRTMGQHAKWGLLVCGRRWLFSADPNAALPEPLRTIALGLRALPRLQYVGESLVPGPWCYQVPLWGNPLIGTEEDWDWFGEQRCVFVGLDFVLPQWAACPGLQSVGQAAYLLRMLESTAVQGPDEAVAREVYRVHVWGPVLNSHPTYPPHARGRQLALQHARLLVSCIPPDWFAAAAAYSRAHVGAGSQQISQPRVTAASLEPQRARLCGNLGWHLPCGRVVRVGDLTVRRATQLQALGAHAAIADRHADFTLRVRLLDVAAVSLPSVCDVLARWWKLRVPNVYKEAAWRLTLNAFPTAQRMQLPNSACVACERLNPGVGHHFWDCPVARAVCAEIEGQLASAGMLAAGRSLVCRNVWLGVKPHASLSRWVWDVVCVAAVHAMDVGRAAAWAVSQRLPAAQLVRNVACRAATAAFWSVMADVAATAVVPGKERVALLSRQPFLAWHTVVVRGNGLQLVRR